MVWNILEYCDNIKLLKDESIPPFPIKHLEEVCMYLQKYDRKGVIVNIHTSEQTTSLKATVFN